MSWPRRLRRAVGRHPSRGVMRDHHVFVDHDDHGSTASCECGAPFPIRLEPDDAHHDANLHLARMLARRVVGHLADDLADSALLEALERAGVSDELAAVLAVCRTRAETVDDVAGW